MYHDINCLGITNNFSSLAQEVHTLSNRWEYTRGTTPHPRQQFNVFSNYMEFSGNFGKNTWLAPLPTGNPGSVTDILSAYLGALVVPHPGGGMQEVLPVQLFRRHATVGQQRPQARYRIVLKRDLNSFESYSEIDNANLRCTL